MAQPAWHYTRGPWITACGRRTDEVRIVTSEPREATCKKCVASADPMGEL